MKILCSHILRTKVSNTVKDRTIHRTKLLPPDPLGQNHRLFPYPLGQISKVVYAKNLHGTHKSHKYLRHILCCWDLSFFLFFEDLLTVDFRGWIVLSFIVVGILNKLRNSIKTITYKALIKQHRIWVAKLEELQEEIELICLPMVEALKISTNTEPSYSGGKFATRILCIT